MEPARKVDIYACGNNAWRQLEAIRPTTEAARLEWSIGTHQQLGNELSLTEMAEEAEDFHFFRKVLSVSAVEVPEIRAGLCWTIVKTPTGLYSAGESDPDFLMLNDSNFHYVGISGNGTRQTGDDFLSLIAHVDRKHLQGDLTVKQLVANQTSWTALCHDGSVWSWGDARFPGCLGREVDSENLPSKPAAIPNLHPSNIDSTITKIASGGFLAAAVTSSHDIYVWGSPDPATSRPVIPDLSGDPTPLIIRDPIEHEREFDFLDIGIGAKHVIVLTTDGRIFTIGDKANGQLGLGDEGIGESGITTEWTEVNNASRDSRRLSSGDGGRIVGVAAGGNASFVVVDRSVEDGR